MNEEAIPNNFSQETRNSIFHKEIFDSPDDFTMCSNAFGTLSYFIPTLCRKMSIFCKSLTVQFGHQWNFYLVGDFGAIQSNIRLSYSLNKLLARYLKLSKKEIAYFHRCYFYIIQSLNIWSDTMPEDDVEQIPSVVCKYRYNIENDYPPFIYFQQLSYSEPCCSWFFHYLFLDFLFIECVPGYNLTSCLLKFKGFDELGEYFELDTTISAANSLLLQRTKQSDIYAVSFGFPEPLNGPTQVKSYIQKIFHDRRDASPFQVHRLRGSAISLMNVDAVGFPLIMALQRQ